jgi:flagellin-like hook-associated protein FlgL
MIETSHSKSKSEASRPMVQNEIVELAEHVEQLLSELSNDNEYSASKSEVFFFTSNDELQKKMG